MANIHGKNASFRIQLSTCTAASPLTNDGNNTTLTESVNNPENTGFGDNSVQRAASGLNDAKLTYEGWAQDDSGSGNLVAFFAAKGVGIAASYGPAGSAAGAVQYSACWVIDDSEIRSPVAGLTVARATFSLASGSVTKGTWA